jgi:drug/metabolite transporter (DMT)-like permease
MWMVYAVAAAALWGLEYAIMGRLLDGRLSPLSLLAIQMAVGTLLIGSVALATGSFHRDVGTITSNATTLRLIVISSLVFALGSYMIATSIQEGNAVLAGLVEISYPLFILLFLIMFGWNEPIGLRALFGGGLILAGAILVQSAT